LNMPTVAVSDLVVKDDDLVVGTQGRSIWILDDLTPIRQWTKAIGDKANHAFPTPPAIRWYRHELVSNLQKVAAGDNPLAGALLTYYLKEKAKTPLVIEVFDEKNKRVVKIEGKEKEKEMDADDDDAGDDDGEADDDPKKPEIPGDKGINRFAWDLK